MKHEVNEFGIVKYQDLELQITVTDGMLCAVGFSTEPNLHISHAPLVEDICTQIQDYLAGFRTEFSIDISLHGTDFQILVWEALLEIPYGETRTYRQVAEQIGKPKAYRAVGQACNRNSIPLVIPCHRVVGSDQSLTGYAGGLKMKKYLLDLEKRKQEKL